MGAPADVLPVRRVPAVPADITAEFNRLVAACGLPKIRLHDLRHNVASLLLATGMPFSSVMKITGHDEDTLKKIYHHVVGEIVTPEMQNAYDWMEALQASEQAKAEYRAVPPPSGR